MSSAESVRSRLTAEPTVPYPSRPTGTSTDAMNLRDLFANVQRAQARADRLDLRLGEPRAVLVEGGLPTVHLRDPVAGKGAVPDRAECGAHVLAHVLVHDPRPDGVGAVLGGVGDREVHALDAAFEDQVGDQLQLVQALVVGDLGLVAGLDQRLEPELNQLRDAAAEHGLLAEEVGLRLLGERRLDHPGPRRTERSAVGEGEVARMSARVLSDGDDGWSAVALLVEAADDVPRPLWRDHDHVVARRWRDAPVMHVEAMRKEDRGALGKIRSDLVLVERGLRAVRHQ